MRSLRTIVSMLAASLGLAIAPAGCRDSSIEPVAAPAPSASPPALVLTVVGTNDLHGHIEALPNLGGYLDILRDQGPVLLVDGGDLFQGTLVSNLGEGAAVIAGYNALGYAAAAVGNHEFDFGPQGAKVVPAGPDDDPRGALLARAAEADFPLLVANLRRRSGKAVRFPPATMVEVDSISVGIVGVTTIEALETTIAANVTDLEVEPLAAAIDRHARDLRRRGAQVVVVVAHAGAACRAFDAPDDRSSCDDGEIFQVAEALEPGLVDVIVGGHTHQAVAHRVGRTAIVESYAKGAAFWRV
ncbi:MAG: metallophosphoesterase, partial [Myxococcota bacterium]